MAIADFLATNANTPVPGTRVSGTQQVQSSLASFLDSNSPYMENARRRGLETAAARGGINSSIAAGASQRAALEAAVPLAQQAVAIDQSAIQAERENWLSQQNFGRALFGQTFSNSMNMLSAIQQYSMEDPELYTPEVVSGYSNFFQQNMNNILKNYFGG